MRVLVTGAAGTMGCEVVERFERDGHHEVIGLTRRDLDVGDRDAVLQCIFGVQPHVILSCAAFTAVDDCETESERAFRDNAYAVRHLAEGSAQVGAHLVHISTDYVFDGTKPEPYHEWDDPNPQSVYGRSKLAGEREALLALGSACTVARTSWVCGRYGPNMVKTVLRLVADGVPMRFVSDQRGCPTFAEDLAAMLYTLAVERRPGLFHVTNQGAVSWHEFVSEIVRQSGGDAALVEAITTAQLNPPRAAARPANSVLDNAALRLSGIAPLPHYREALARCLQAIGA